MKCREHSSPGIYIAQQIAQTSNMVYICLEINILAAVWRTLDNIVAEQKPNRVLVYAKPKIFAYQK